MLEYIVNPDAFVTWLNSVFVLKYVTRVEFMQFVGTILVPSKAAGSHESARGAVETLSVPYPAQESRSSLSSCLARNYGFW